MARTDWTAMDRRRFFRAVGAGTAAIGAGALALGGAAPAQAHTGKPHSGRHGPRLFPPSKIGIQLWSVRTVVPELGFRRVFEELSDMGYREVEFFTYDQGEAGPITVAEIRQALDDNGLKAVGVHRGLGDWRDNMEAELDDAETLGLTYVGTAAPPTDWGGETTVDAWLAAAEEFNGFGEAVAARGMRFYQHNHAGEFAFASDDPDTRLYDVFLENTDPKLVYLQMDIFWAYAGQHQYPGFEPLDYVLDNPRRYPLFHVKDGVGNPDSPDGYDMIEFGAGELPYQEFFSALRRCGNRRFHPIWEQDNAHETAVPPHPIDPLGNAERSYEAMRALRARRRRRKGRD